MSTLTTHLGLTKPTNGDTSGWDVSLNGDLDIIDAALFATPKIVATLLLTNQSAATAITTLYTPASAGLFRLNFYATVTTLNTGGTGSYWSNLTYNSGTGMGAVTVVLLGVGLQLYTYTKTSSVQIFWSGAGQPIQYDISVSNNTVGRFMYNIVLEQLV